MSKPHSGGRAKAGTTTRRKAKAAPSRSTPATTDLAAAVLASTEDHIYMYDREMRYVYAGSAGARALGLTPEQFLGKTWRELGFPAEILEPIESKIREVFETGVRLSGETQFPLLAGIGYYRYILAPVRDDAGNVTAVLSTVHDVTDSERMRRAIDAIGAPMRSVIGGDYLRALVIHLSRVLGVRHALVGELLPGREERIRVVAGADAGTLLPSVEYALRGTPCETVFRRDTCVYRDGVQQQFPSDTLLVDMGAESYVGTPLRSANGEPLGLLAILDDKPMADAELATSVLEVYAARAGAELERRRSESELQRIRDLLVAAERVGHLGSFQWDIASGAVQWSPGMYELYGVDPASAPEITFDFAMSFVNRDDVPTIESNVRRALGGGPMADMRYRILRPDRNERRLWGHGQVLRRANGTPERMVGVVQDQTDRQRAEAAMRESEERYRSLVEHSTVGIYRSSLDGRFQFVNAALVRMLGYESEAELMRSDIARDIYLDPSDRARLVREYGDARELGGVDVQWRRKDGSPITVRLSGSPRRGTSGLEGFDVLAEDVTQRRLIEQRLHQSQRIEAVGRLAGGIAHDLNNLMTVVRVYADLLIAEMDTSDRRLKDTQEIRSAAERAAALTHQLLAFSRQQVLTPRVLDVNTIVAHLDHMLRRIIGEDIALVMDLDAEGRVRADPGQLEQVIMNLVVNARDAMPEGGRLEIRTRDVRALGDRTGIDESEGPFVVVEVRDSGIGMDAQTQARIFEPFFTTKPVGSGTGLGLATAYGIVKQSGGYIFADSELGKGTTFTIFLPRVDGTLEWPVQAAPTVGAVSGDEVILVVEDDATVRRVVVQSLKRLGYRVLEAQDGAEALALAEAELGDIRVLLTDVIMPGIGGSDLAARLLARRPSVAVIFMSGYAGDANTSDGLGYGARFIAKPFSTDELASLVREVLETPTRAR